MGAKEFAPEFLEELTDRKLQFDPGDGFVKVVDEITGSSRWSTLHTMVFRDPDGRYWRSHYSQGATEMQDHGPYEYDDPTADEVEPVEVVVIEYRAIREPQPTA